MQVPVSVDDIKHKCLRNVHHNKALRHECAATLLCEATILLNLIFEISEKKKNNHTTIQSLFFFVILLNVCYVGQKFFCGLLILVFFMTTSLVPNSDQVL